MEKKKNDTKFGFALGSSFAFGGILTIIIDFEHIIMENIMITLLLILGMVGMGTGISNANDEKEKVLMNTIFTIYVLVYVFFLMNMLFDSEKSFISIIIILALMILNGVMVHSLLGLKSISKYIINLLFVIVQIVYLLIKMK